FSFHQSSPFRALLSFPPRRSSDLVAGLDPVRILAIGDMADGDIPVRERADNVAVLADRQKTDIDRAHFFSGIFDAGIGFNTFHVAAHDFADFHDGNPPKSIDAVYVY